MNYCSLRSLDVANGEGVRASLFVSGCRHRCKGCFSPTTWDFSCGNKYTKKTEDELLSYFKNGYLSGLSILGGDPMEPENQQPILELLRRFKELYPSKTVWLYTGCIYEELIDSSGWFHYRTDKTDEILSLADVLVDGPFIEEKRNISLNFRGSSNQRIIDLNRTRQSGVVELWHPA